MLGYAPKSRLGSNVTAVKNSRHVNLETGLILQALLDYGQGSCGVNDESGNYWRWLGGMPLGAKAS